MKFNLAKSQRGLPIPATDADKEKFSKVGIGEVFTCKTISRRNYEFHKKYFALLEIGYKNLPEEYDGNFPTIDDFREELTIAAGFYTIRKDFYGNEKKKAKSISFGKMSDEEFQVLYDRTVDLICRLIGVDKPDLLREIVEQFG